MKGGLATTRFDLAVLAGLMIGVIACVIGASVNYTGFTRAWLCAFLFWLGVPLAGVTLVLIHDLTGGYWMMTARPLLNAAIVTMPLATLSAIPAFVALAGLYSWTHPTPDLGNTLYLNAGAFYLRYAVDVVLWNLLAAFALWAPRGSAMPIAPALSWISAVGLILLALSASFAAIDWVLSLEPGFWSSVFPMTIGAGWVNTGLALVLLTVAVAAPPGPARNDMADLAAILLATVIFWAYVEFIQFLIIWEENLKTEIGWYLVRIDSVWRPALFVSVGLGFFLPFFALLTAPAKRSRIVVATTCLLILLSRVAANWWLVLPEFPQMAPFWLDVAAIFALGGLILLPFGWAVRRPAALRAGGWPLWKPGHG